MDQSAGTAPDEEGMVDGPEAAPRPYPRPRGLRLRLRGGWTAWIALVLSAAAVAFSGFRLALGAREDDVDSFESPLMMAMARQWIVGPGELYGPFDGANPLVLIHAPLYYRIGGLLAWPLDALGTPPLDAARWAGRGLSLVSWACLLGCAYRLGRLGGLPRRAGVWSTLLFASSPVLGGLSVAVRPDMLGAALLCWGVLEALSALDRPSADVGRLVRALAALGLAVCVKQQFATAGLTTVGVLLLAAPPRRPRAAALGTALAAGTTVVALIYGLEWALTDGRVLDAVFRAPRALGTVHPGGWLHVATVLSAVIGKSAGPIAIGAAAVFTMAARPGAGVFGAPGFVSGRWARRLGTLVVIALAGFSIAQVVVSRWWTTGPVPVLALLALVCASAASLGAARAGRAGAARGAAIANSAMPVPGPRWDAVFAVYVVVELVAAAAFAWTTTGAWINYAIPALVFGAALAGRALERALGHARGLPPRMVLSLAALAVLGGALLDVKEEASRRRTERAALVAVLRRARRPASSYFFADRPGLNRLIGQLSLVFDDWLYPAFESLHLAEPRARWLLPRLVYGPVDVVILTSERDRVRGVPTPLDELGYHRAFRAGPFVVWARERRVARAIAF